MDSGIDVGLGIGSGTGLSSDMGIDMGRGTNTGICTGMNIDIGMGIDTDINRDSGKGSDAKSCSGVYSCSPSNGSSDLGSGFIWVHCKLGFKQEFQVQIQNSVSTRMSDLSSGLVLVSSRGLVIV